MDFTNLDGFKIFYYLILMIIFVAGMWWLIKSAMNSLKRTGGKISSIFDEIGMAAVLFVGFIIIAQLEPNQVITFLRTPVVWGFDLLLKALRFVGFPV
ncbi:hypothetical protein ACWG0P_10920 [Amedibacillus sp. YH-ame6]